MASVLLPAPCARAALTLPTTIDFSIEDDGVTPLVNGQSIDDEFGVLFSISSDADTNGHLGPAIFDTTPGGPNDNRSPNNDDDLIVDLGNALILQNSDLPTQTTLGVFDIPDDEADPSDLGEITFEFTAPVELESIDLIDINGDVTVEVTLVDADGRARTYSVPEKWTFDISASGLPPTAKGFDTLVFTTIADQEGEGSGGPATALEDPGFDPAAVVSLQLEFGGSAAIDNLRITSQVPEPATLVLALLTLAACRRR